MASGQKPFFLVLGIIVVGGITFIASRTVTGTISIPANAVVTTADTSGFRGYVTGAAGAPIEVTEYGDLECPACANFATVQFADVKLRLIDTRKIRYRYRDYPLVGPHKHPYIAAHAAACANDQGKYWEVQEMMFQQQTDYAFANDPVPALQAIMKSAGLDVSAWHDCMKSAKYAGRIKASFDEGEKLGINSTPTFLIGGSLYPNLNGDKMVKVVDSLIALMPAPAPAAPTGTPIPTGGQ